MDIKINKSYYPYRFKTEQEFISEFENICNEYELNPKYVHKDYHIVVEMKILNHLMKN